jgi:FtsP/CotA-like multicopper oxidase with cupredoxin domain
MDSLVVPAGRERDVRFVADAEGTYYYWGTTTNAPFEDREFEDSQLTGALIVDPAGEPIAPGLAPAAPGDGARPQRDRVLVLGMYFDAKDAEGEGDFSGEFLVINGRPWPLTERMTYGVGDSVRWRLINATPGVHPMHLHGFFYRVDARGDFAQDTLYWPAQRRMAVTERMDPGSTMSLAWSPDRPGAWLFHCHLNWHVVASPSLDPDRATAEEREEALLRGSEGSNPEHRVARGMGGLMMAVNVQPPPGWHLDVPERRKLRLFVQSDSIEGDARPRFGYVLQEGDAEPAPDSVPVPSSTIVAWKGQPTQVTVINRLREPTQVHWHGLEIESYYDGVAGVSGTSGQVTPPIAPGDSFVMRITPPRSGSYMYHTHVNDIRQQGAGLYGAFLVIDEGETPDPERDRVELLANDRNFHVALNGTDAPRSTTMVAGRTYRLRFMNITLQNAYLHVRLVRGDVPVRWTQISKDGWDLPAWQRKPEPADRIVSIGETVDVEVTPRQVGDLQLEVRAGRGRLLLSQPVRVVARSARKGSGPAP